MTEAQLVAANEYGVELRMATRKADVWPGYHWTNPLGKAGYWIGTAGNHRYVGREMPSAEEMEFYELEEV